MENIITISDLCYTYTDGNQALRNVCLTIPAQSRIAILGPNGAGKSTLLLHFNGIYVPQRGQIRINGEILNRKNEKKMKSFVGLVFQDPDDQVFSPSVWEDVAFGPINMGCSPEEVDKRVEEALKSVDMWESRYKIPNRLSYGQKKRIAIAGILAMDCPVIVLDEPVAYLDPKGQDDLFLLLDKLHQEGKTIIIATHDVDLASEWADGVVILKDGTILMQGGTELLTDEELIETAHLRLPIVAKLFKEIPEFKYSHYPKNLNEARGIIREWLYRK